MGSCAETATRTRRATATQHSTWVVGGGGGRPRGADKKAPGPTRHYNASFAGFLPAENPRLTILVTITDPPGAGPHYGGNTAAHVFSGIAHEALQQLQIPPSPNGGACPAPAK